jgi:hypothetical protein
MRKSLTLIALALVAGANATVVYDNTAALTHFATGGGNLMADETTLAQSDLAIDSATMFFYAPEAHSGVSLLAEIRDTNPADGGVGNVLGSKTVWFDIVNPGVYYIDIVFDQKIVVPDQYVWTSWNFSGDNNAYGLLCGGDPTVGSSNDYFGQWNPTTGVWDYWWFGGTPKSNFGIKLNASPVPEPASVIAIGAGLAALAARRRRK